MTETDKANLEAHKVLRDAIAETMAGHGQVDAAVGLAVLLELSYLHAVAMYGREQAMEMLSMAVNTYQEMYANK